MKAESELISTIYEGWQAYQEVLIRALRPLTEDQLALQASPQVRSVEVIARHMIGARARWFYQLLGEGGNEFKTLGNWDRRGRKARSAEELISGLERTWQGMQAAISSWSPQDWEQTWGNDRDYGPKIFTRQWVIWHLLEHDLFHGGEISMILGMHGISGVDL